ncbi:hypothetical protein GCM10029976_090750 [Kribbella albertanoniae]|uniref:Uncharacterized protein n=1 Tax=Kribbella albertanoniae TaxID=1266829 RepID=A0A4V2XPI0_9ACTN|nr:hypothetical protein [Kribbella albertanoniae]TDC22145.1 hypothetical protein E1261_31645 [Kribbella albertanoniae]
MKTKPRYFTYKAGHHNVRPWGDIGTPVGEVIKAGYRWRAKRTDGTWLPDARTTFASMSEAADALLKAAGYE